MHDGAVLLQAIARNFELGLLKAVARHNFLPWMCILLLREHIQVHNWVLITQVCFLAKASRCRSAGVKT